MLSAQFPVSERYKDANILFNGKTETFWKAYNRELAGIPLKDSIIKSISNETNLLGEGFSKKGYNFAGLKNYVIRVYKKCFKIEDLEQGFNKPKNTSLNILDGVVLNIPGKIDIVKKKAGTSLGVNNYAGKILPPDALPMQNICVTREETLRAMKTYEQMKDFPIESYRQAYSQIKRFCSKPGFQFDIISPNNILVDTKTKKINLIDPSTPDVNKPVFGIMIDFSDYYGCDSLYPVLCDFLMHKEHLNNLTPQEKVQWQNAVNKIILKCIYAGKAAGFNRNIDKLKILYGYIKDFWKCEEPLKTYEWFLNTYSGSINQGETAKKALNYRNKELERIRAIFNLNFLDFDDVKPVFEKILEAPHQPKVEFPEIINAVLDKLRYYGNDAKSLIPSLEKLFDKEIFFTTKKRLYQLFINLSPDNERFLKEIAISADNPLEKTLFEKEFEALADRNKRVGERIHGISKSGKRLSKELADKLWISRTCMNTGKVQDKAIENMVNAYRYIESKKFSKPKSKELINLHKIALENIPGEDFLAGKLRTPDTDELVKQVFHITKDTKKTVNDYSPSSEVINGLKKLDKFIDENYNTMEPFEFASKIFLEVIRIHPFINGNGRAARLFTEQFLLSKGYRLMKWPEETLYRKIISPEQMTELIKQNSVKAV